MSRDNFRFFFQIYDEEKWKQKIAPVNYLCYLLFFKVWKFDRILTALKFFTAYLILVVKFLSFIAFSRLPSIYDGELRQKNQFLIATCKQDAKTKICQYSLTVYHPSHDSFEHLKVVHKKLPLWQNLLILSDLKQQMGHCSMSIKTPFLLCTKWIFHSICKFFGSGISIRQLDSQNRQYFL